MSQDTDPNRYCPFPKRFPSQLNKDALFFMQLAYNQAIEAWKKDEVPVGAVITLNDEVIATAHNEVERTKDPTAHAEMLAITQASARIGDWRLNEARLFVTKEPCPMCSGAAIMARLGEVIFAVPDKKMGCFGGSHPLHQIKGLNHQVKIQQGIMEVECLELLQAFFQEKRSKASLQEND